MGDSDPPKRDLEDEYPSVEDAYAFVLASYDWTLRRFDAIDTRLRQVAMAAASATLGVPVAARALDQGGSLEFWWLYWLGATIGVVVVVLALWFQTSAHLRLPLLEDIWNQNLHKSIWEFKKDQIKFAADRQNANTRVVNARGRYAMWCAAAFGVQVVVMAIWVTLNLAAGPGDAAGVVTFV